jgi:hypothetical protein
MIGEMLEQERKVNAKLVGVEPFSRVAGAAGAFDRNGSPH